MGIQVIRREEPHPYWEGKVMRFREGVCVCKRTLSLEFFTNSCDCGREYNSSGQLLAGRECWGEETGEHPADLGNL